MTSQSRRHLWRAMIAAVPDDQTSLIGRQPKRGVAGSVAQTPVAAHHRTSSVSTSATYAAPQALRLRRGSPDSVALGDMVVTSHRELAEVCSCA
jgi:hypothetical protein